MPSPGFSPFASFHVDSKCKPLTEEQRQFPTPMKPHFMVPLPHPPHSQFNQPLIQAFVPFKSMLFPDLIPGPGGFLRAGRAVITRLWSDPWQHPAGVAPDPHAEVHAEDRRGEGGYDVEV